MAYTPTPEFIAAIEQIDSLISDTNTPAPVASLATATKGGLMELAAKQQMLQTMVEEQQQNSQQLMAASSQQKLSAQITQEQSADAQPQDGVIEAAPPPPLSVPPGTYEAPRTPAAAASAVPSSYEAFRGDPKAEKK